MASPFHNVPTTTALRSIAEHGSRRRYQQGCKCTLCRAANAAYKADRKATHQARQKAFAETISRHTGTVLDEEDIRRVPVPTVEHGTAKAYEYYGCRCDPCATNMKEVRAARKFIKQLDPAA